MLVHAAENITAVCESVAEEPRMSIACHLQQLSMSKTTTWQILKKDLVLHMYRIQMIEKLKPADHRQRHSYNN